MKNSILYLLFIILFPSCIEMMRYNKDVKKAIKNEKSFSEIDKKYYKFYDKSYVDDTISFSFLNKVFLNERINSLTNKQEFACITFFLNSEKRLVFKKSKYFETMADVISYLDNKSTWSGYAVKEGNLIKTEYLYNYNWSLTHQITLYTYSDTTLTRIEMFRYGYVGDSNRDKIEYTLMK